MTFIAIQDSMELTLMEKKLTISNAIQEGTSLRVLDKKMGSKNLLKAITFLIMRTSAYFNISKPLNDSQSAMLASDLLEIFGYETIEDVFLMFKYARQGKFEKSFSRIDSETVFGSWMPEYLELKAIEREKILLANKNSKIVTTDEVEKLNEEDKVKAKTQLKEIKTHLLSINKPTKSPSDFRVNTMNEVAQEWLLEFDELRYKKELPFKIITISDFLNFKLRSYSDNKDKISYHKIQKWANEFRMCKDQDKLPAGIKTYTQYFEFKSTQ